MPISGDILPRDQCSLLGIPLELREEILKFTLGLDHVIVYGSSSKHHYFHYTAPYTRRTCVERGFNNVHTRVHRPISIMRANKQLYIETRRILYNRKFQLDIGVDSFFVHLSSLDLGRFRHFKFELMQSIIVNVEAISNEHENVVRRLAQVCQVLADAPSVRHIKVQLWFGSRVIFTFMTMEQLLLPFTRLWNAKNLEIIIRSSRHGLACACDEEGAESPIAEIDLSGGLMDMWS